MGWLNRMASRFDDWLDRRRMERRRRKGQDDPVTVIAYPGWGDGERLWLRGSVVEEGKTEKPHAHESVWGDLMVTLKRFTAAEIMGATVRVRAGGAEAVCTTDSDGFFLAELPVSSPRDVPADRRWRPVDVRLEDFPGRRQNPVAIEAQALVPVSAARFGIISDIDDTVLRTGIAEPLKNWRTIIESDAEARVAFPGLAPLYRGLEKAGGETSVNPVFYVSSGSWRLYDLVARFMQINDIPRGPAFMDDWGLEETHWFKASHGSHKIEAIETLLALYPELNFILVGDSGQADAQIYADMVKKHGSRIMAVWIRDVSGAARDAEVAELLREARQGDRPVFAEENLLDAARDAAARGWIDDAALAAVEDAIREAEGAT